MSRSEMMADALRLMGRAAAYHRIFLGELIPHSTYPERLWSRRDSYYSRPALDVYVRLNRVAEIAIHNAILGTPDLYGEEAEALTPADIRRQAEALARQLETGAMVLEAVERPLRPIVIHGATEHRELAEAGVWGSPTFGQEVIGDDPADQSDGGAL